MQKLPDSVLSYEVEQRPSSVCLRIEGPLGRVEIPDMVWVADRTDYIELIYRECLKVRDGIYHCCFTDRIRWY